MAPANPIVNLIVQGARARGLDPAAVLAVASQEGLSGRIGDGGHAYGAFQLNNAGGVITGSHPAVSDAATQAWANSPAGINFALDRIAQVAKGLHGAQAVNAIVTRFERPANPGREVAGANAAYGNYSGTTLPAGPPQTVFPAVQSRPTASGNTLAVLNEGAKLFGLPPLPAIPSPALPTRLPTAGPVAPSSPAPAQPTKLKATGPTLPWLEHQAAPFGLTTTATTNGTHAPGSYHYQKRAIDLAGAPQNMAAAMNYALQHPSQFTEAFYTGPGHPNFFISDGKVLPLSQLDPKLYAEHTNHVHWAR